MIAQTTAKPLGYRPVFWTDVPRSPAEAAAIRTYDHSIVRWLVAAEAERVAAVGTRTAASDILASLELLDQFDR